MRAVLLEARLAAAPGLPGPLQDLVLDIEAPAALGDPSKVGWAVRTAMLSGRMRPSHTRAGLV